MVNLSVIAKRVECGRELFLSALEVLHNNYHFNNYAKQLHPYFLFSVCESLSNPTNGGVVINDSTRVVGSIATYSCDDGFLLSGSIERECQDNGMWSGNEPLCIGRTRGIT